MAPRWDLNPTHSGDITRNPHFSVRLELNFTHLDLCIQFVEAFKLKLSLMDLYGRLQDEH
jgi:hypothetical protein